MSWYAFDPAYIDEDPCFARVSPAAFTLAFLMVNRSLKRGHLAPDPRIYRGLWGDRFVGFDFDAVYREAITCFEPDAEGLLHIPWIDDAREATLKRLTSTRLRVQHHRESKRERAACNGLRNDVRNAPTGQDKTGQDKTQPLTPSGKAPAEPVVWPKELQTPEFQATWDEYVRYRRERKLSAYKPTGLKRLIGEMLEVGHDQAILGLQRTISKNWQGPHFEKAKTVQAPTRLGSADYLPELS